jgi:hypothetical protein
MMFGYWQDWFDAARFGFETQHVIALRLMHIAPGGARAAAETQRMVTEKTAALFASQAAATAALIGGQSFRIAAKRAAVPYRGRVRANRRRLMRQRS